MNSEKILETIKIILSRVYVKLLSMTRASHSKQIEYFTDTEEELHVETPLPPSKPRERNIKSQNKKSLIIVAIVLLLVFTMYMEVYKAPASFPIGELVNIQEGKPLVLLADSLEEQGVVRSAWWLTVLMRLNGTDGDVHAGDYLFKESKNIFDLARIISTGAFGLEPVRITIPEGVNITQIAKIYERKMLRFDKEKFLKLAQTEEGYLFPDTYFFLPNAKEEELIRVMRGNFDSKIKDLTSDIIKSGKSMKDIVVMASIVEREARVPRDQKMISGVLWHRIDIGMPLQVDATFVYTHSKGSSQITMDELQDKSNLYNTYAHKGLPPGPIASPGLSALRAAVHPIENTYLFYLADNKGRTYFSKSYEEHMAKRRKYIHY